MSTPHDPFDARSTLALSGGTVEYYRLAALEDRGLCTISRLPFSIRVLLEAALRHVDGQQVLEVDVERIARWCEEGQGSAEIPFKPARVLMQDFTGVPAVVDLAAMRAAMARLGGDPSRINPLVPVDLVIDHSVQVDMYGSRQALAENVKIEFMRNAERYAFLKWGSHAFADFRVVPPATGIVHQVNLEYLASVVALREEGDRRVAFPDSLVGTDSHTTMINGLGVVGWGVGGIEAEGNMLGQPIFMIMPEVIGFKLEGRLPEGATATDVVLTVTEFLRREKVVGKFVEFFGPGMQSLSLADRATLANMAPEYGATMGFFPVDEETLAYLRGTGRSADQVELVEAYCRAQGLFYTADAPDPQYTRIVSLDMGSVVPCLAGPKRPQDRVPLSEAKTAFEGAAHAAGVEGDLDGQSGVPVEVHGRTSELMHGSVVIAAITSCTNTSNPSVMLGAGLVAKKAVERGLRVPAHVKTSLAPGSRVVTAYLKAAGLIEPLEELGFDVVGYGCTTCIGNSGPLPDPVREAVRAGKLVVASVLSGNRNFEGRVNPDTRANYLASPPLVVAYALAGRMNIDLVTEPIGTGSDGQPVFLSDIWPSAEEIRETTSSAMSPEQYGQEYGRVFEGTEAWRAVPVARSELYEWRDDSTYIKEPTFFEGLGAELPGATPIEGARALLRLGDSVTTDHISPAGAIPADGPAGKYLISKGVEPKHFNSFGSRRGNHEVMVRGTFANIRIRNQLAPGTEGGWTRHMPDGEVTSVYDAAMRYAREGTPLVVIAGKEYGTGSSRDWAAKGTMLLGVRAVLVESYERIHRSNLIGMGVLPLEFLPGESAQTHGLTGEETYDIVGVSDEMTPRCRLDVVARDAAGEEQTFWVRSRIDSQMELVYYRNGGILQTVLRQMLAED